jgi:hypothetical protein
MDKVKQIADTLGLLSSMIYGGEEHSETSKKARHGAFLNLKALEAENAALKSSVLSEWVPVSVRLPDKACMVVVAFPGMGMLMQCRAAIYMDGSFSYPSSDQKVRDVRYWTPINPPMNSEA